MTKNNSSLDTLKNIDDNILYLFKRLENLRDESALVTAKLQAAFDDKQKALENMFQDNSEVFYYE